MLTHIPGAQSNVNQHNICLLYTSGLYVCGMAVSAVSGTPRMGPIFGGMLLSGKKVANLIIKELAKK